MNILNKFIQEELNKLKRNSLYRELKYIESSQDTYTTVGGRKLLLLSSNNYLGLCNDVRLKEAAIDAIKTYGVGSGGSRLTTGSFVLHRELESKLAEFKNTEDCIVYNTGYMANLGAISALLDKNSVVYCDKLNHASIIDGCRLSGAKLVIYRHCDMEDLLKKVRRYPAEKGLIVSDGVFSMDGDIAPLDKMVDIAKDYKLMTMVDDAHATGILGKTGAGTAEYFGLEDDIDIKMGTLSKALAGEGGYIAGSKLLIEYLRNKSKSFVYSTAIAPHNIAVSIKALEILREEPWRRESLLENSTWFQEKLLNLGFNIKRSNTAIIPVMIGESDTALKFSTMLFQEGVYISAIRPPTVPKDTSRLRITIMATHTKDDLKKAIDKMIKIGMELNVIS